MRPIAANRMDQPTPRGSQTTMDHLAQSPVVWQADVFEHADRSKYVELAVDVAPIVLDKLNAVLQALKLGTLPGEFNLLA